MTKVKDIQIEIQDLKEHNEFLQRQNNALRLELQRIKSMSMFEFANEFCNDDQLEEAGHALARSLGVGMTHEEIEIEKAENAYIPYTAEDF